MDNGGSFKVPHGPDAAEVTNVHKALVQEVGDMVREREMRIVDKEEVELVVKQLWEPGLEW